MYAHYHQNNILEKLQINKHNPGVYDACENWRSAPSTLPIISVNPATEENLASVTCANLECCKRVITNARLSAESWRSVPAPARGNIVRRIGALLRKNKDALGSLISLEAGKTKQESDGEVQEMIDMADFAVGQSRMLYGKTMHSERINHRMYEQWLPLGVVAIITAFNFPVAVWAWNAFIAAITGNCVIWRPSPKTPLCAIAVQKLCHQAMQETGYHGIFSLLIEKEPVVAKQLTNDNRVALVSFTGSSLVGQRVGTTVAARMGRSILELSGNNALIIDQTANLDLAMPAVVFGAIGTTGQRCTTTRRLFLHTSLYDEVRGRLQKAYRQISIGNPLDHHVLMGPLIDASARKNYLAAIASVKTAGGSFAVEGGALEGPGYFVSPSIAISENHWPLVQTETFGPLLHLMRFDHLTQAIEMQNSVPQGLSSALFTNNLVNAELFLSAQGSDCGIANINIGTSGAEIGGAFGGEKATGGGREAGSDTWQSYMRRQTNTINWGNDLPLAQGISFNVPK